MQRFLLAEILTKIVPRSETEDKEKIKHLIDLLLRKNIKISFGLFDDGKSDINEIIDKVYDSKNVQFGQNSSFIANFNPDWSLPSESITSLDWEVWKKRSQLLFRLSVATLPSEYPNVPFELYNDIAKEMKQLVASLHYEQQGFISLIGHSRNFTMGKYNTKKADLLVDWCSIYGKELQDKHRINDYLPQPKGIILEKVGDNMILMCAKSYSEYLKTGWDEESRAWWEMIGGKIIYKKPVKKTRNDGKTFILEKVDKKTGEAKLKPFELP